MRGAMGSVQLGFSGGEPLTRKDLPELIRAARATSGSIPT